MLRLIHENSDYPAGYSVSAENCYSLRQHHIVSSGISITCDNFNGKESHPATGRLLTCFSGEGRILIEGEWRESVRGTVYVMPPKTSHAYASVSKWVTGWVVYSAHKTGLATLAQPALVETDPRQLEYILSGLCHEASINPNSAALEHWVGLLDHQSSQIVSSLHPSRLARLWQAVQENPETQWDLSSLAKLAGLGSEHLRRLCILETGHSPMQHVTHLRMQRAISLIASGQKMESVAENVGYDNAYAFSAAFKRVCGKSPSLFRALDNAN